MATKLYKNTGDKTLNILGVGELAPGEQVSTTGEYLPQVIIENYKGLVDITDQVAEEVSDTKIEVKTASTKPEAFSGTTEKETSNV